MVLWLRGPSYPIERSRTIPDANLSYLYKRQSPEKSCIQPSQLHRPLCARVNHLSFYRPINKTL